MSTALSDRRLGLYLPKVAFNPQGCWLWLAACDTTGYGRFATDDGLVPAHFVLKELVDGPCPDGFDRDHVCHNRDAECPGGRDCVHRRCVRPSHIEYVTRSVNVWRGYHRTGSCRKGHRRTPENTYVNPTTGARMCIPCRRVAQRARRARAMSDA